jgi:hypothetical protein
MYGTGGDKNPELEPDLSGEDLDWEDITGADLSNANLFGHTSAGRTSAGLYYFVQIFWTSRIVTLATPL